MDGKTREQRGDLILFIKRGWHKENRILSCETADSSLYPCFKMGLPPLMDLWRLSKLVFGLEQGLCNESKCADYKS